MNQLEWEQLLECIACCQIGEESYFRRHIHKQATNKNKQAMMLVSAQDKWQQLRNQIQHDLQILKSFGHETIKAVCDVVICMDSYQLQTSKFWTICAITGAMCYECIHVELKTSPPLTVSIDSRFQDLLQCIWILFHIEKIQSSRIAEFESAESNDEKREDKQSISDKVSHFLKQKHKETKKLAATLVLCAQYVNTSLRLSLDALHKTQKTYLINSLTTC